MLFGILRKIDYLYEIITENFLGLSIEAISMILVSSFVFKLVLFLGYLLLTNPTFAHLWQ
jgi:hypothetical protein